MAQVVKRLAPKPDGLGLMSGTHLHVVVHTHAHTELKEKRAGIQSSQWIAGRLVSI